MRKHLAVAVGVVSLACGGYLWTNNTAFAANNDKPVHSVTVSSNADDVTIECHVSGVTGVAPLHHSAMSQPTQLHKQTVGGALHLQHNAAASSDQLETTTKATSQRVTKPFVALKATDHLAATNETTSEQITKPFVTINAETVEGECGTVVAIGTVAGVDWFALAAETIGISADELHTGIEAEQSIADQAAAKGVSKQAVIDAIVAAETTNINQLVADEELSSEDAELFSNDLPEMIEHFVSNVPSFVAGEGVQCFQISGGESGTSESIEEAVECEAVEALPALPSEPATEPSR
ncbi:hypothetical protein [Herpetosiphon giganteus]|uniref:hypothetical protein n=1 Tax=Herpetosiphon giganteus TaxID=2029754 RepID=UPI00195DF4B6|nr:hypothetical protein [Herpetosiphon giganteus]MBM7845499.1 hypothetical protein [Herpetosiphon giganteus]